MIRITLFFANSRTNLNLFEKPKSNYLLQLFNQKVNTLKRIYKNITKIQKKYTNYQNKKIKIVLQLLKEDKVYLFIINLIKKLESKIFKCVQLSLFFIKVA